MVQADKHYQNDLLVLHLPLHHFISFTLFINHITITGHLAVMYCAVARQCGDAAYVVAKENEIL